ncbi:MAG: hypothetical protein LBF09_06230 [Odoribacteraceae bacterium]|nr:hypothetical protein [Odoribacteraceae bacterium]
MTQRGIASTDLPREKYQQLVELLDFIRKSEYTGQIREQDAPRDSLVGTCSGAAATCPRPGRELFEDTGSFRVKKNGRSRESARYDFVTRLPRGGFELEP